MALSSHTVREELRGALVFVGAIWTVSLLGWVFPALEQFGVVPRTLRGLPGILGMPFLHANLHHLVSNTVPLVVLLILLAGSRAASWQVVVDIVLLGGALLWIFGRTAVHIGASGLISGLTVFLMLAGLMEQRMMALLVALLVGFLYGGSLVLGVVPRFGSTLSWDGHLCGAVAGGIVAYVLTRPSAQHPVRTGASAILDLPSTADGPTP